MPSHTPIVGIINSSASISPSKCISLPFTLFAVFAVRRLVVRTSCHTIKASSQGRSSLKHNQIHFTFTMCILLHSRGTRRITKRIGYGFSFSSFSSSCQVNFHLRPHRSTSGWSAAPRREGGNLLRGQQFGFRFSHTHLIQARTSTKTSNEVSNPFNWNLHKTLRTIVSSCSEST